MNSILTSSELKRDLKEAALAILWNNSGCCSEIELVAAGQPEALVSKHGESAIEEAKILYTTARVA